MDFIISPNDVIEDHECETHFRVDYRPPHGTFSTDIHCPICGRTGIIELYFDGREVREQSVTWNEFEIPELELEE